MLNTERENCAFMFAFGFPNMILGSGNLYRNKDENVHQISQGERQREEREKERERKKGRRRDIEREGEIRKREREVERERLKGYRERE